MGVQLQMANTQLHIYAYMCLETLVLAGVLGTTP